MVAASYPDLVNTARAADRTARRVAPAPASRSGELYGRRPVRWELVGIDRIVRPVTQAAAGKREQRYESARDRRKLAEPPLVAVLAGHDGHEQRIGPATARRQASVAYQHVNRLHEVLEAHRGADAAYDDKLLVAGVQESVIRSRRHNDGLARACLEPPIAEQVAHPAMLNRETFLELGMRVFRWRRSSRRDAHPALDEPAPCVRRRGEELDLLSALVQDQSGHRHRHSPP